MGKTFHAKKHYVQSPVGVKELGVLKEVKLCGQSGGKGE